MKIVRKYCWMELLDGGVFRKPEEIGPYYDPTYLQEWYLDKDEAMDDLVAYAKTKSFGIDRYFLMEFHEVQR